MYVLTTDTFYAFGGVLEFRCDDFKYILYIKMKS